MPIPNHQLAPASLEVNWDPFNLTMRADAKVGWYIDNKYTDNKYVDNEYIDNKYVDNKFNCP